MGRPGRATRPPGTDPEERWLPMTILDHDKSKWVRREIRCIYTGDDVKMNLRIRWRSVAPRGRPCARLRLRPRRSPPCATCLQTVQRRISASFRRFRGNFRREFDQTFHLDVWNERTNTTENRQDRATAQDHAEPPERRAETAARGESSSSG